MPEAKYGLLIGMVLGAGLLAGCSTTRLDQAGLNTDRVEEGGAAEPAISPLSEPEAFMLGSDASEASETETAQAPTSKAKTGQSVASDVVLQTEDVATVSAAYAGPTPGDRAALDIFPDPPEARVPAKPSNGIEWAAPETPRGELDRLIAKYAAHYEVPESLVRRVVKRESNFNPKARNGPYWGLMQILPQTAKGMGFRGTAPDLLDAETNLKYAVRYLRGAYLVADGNHDQAVRFYARGYYYDAKRRGMLEETGLGKDRRRSRKNQSA